MEDSNKFSKKVQPRVVIKCPHCDWEYMPDEVLYSEDILGATKTGSIVRDPLGHIIYSEYKEDSEPLAETKYICDNCNKPFVISIDTNFKAKEEQAELDFSTQQVSLW